MSLITPFTAVTKVPIEVAAEEGSALMDSVVGVLAAEVPSKSRVTPVIAPVTTLLALVAAKPLRVKLASCAAWLWVRLVMLFVGSYTRDERPPSPPDWVTVIAFAAPVEVPEMTRRAPPEVLMTLAVTPGLFDAELMAEAMPETVSSLESMVIEVDAPPTASVNVPVPIAAPALENACEVREAAVARFWTSKEYVPGTASESVVAEAMVLSATVASYPASWDGSSRVESVACNVLRALEKVPNADTCAFNVVCSVDSSLVCAAPKLEVSAETMALILSPEPMPVDVISELAEAALAVLELPVDDTAELMLVGLWCACWAYRQSSPRLKQDAYQPPKRAAAPVLRRARRSRRWRSPGSWPARGRRWRDTLRSRRRWPD